MMIVLLTIVNEMSSVEGFQKLFNQKQNSESPKINYIVVEKSDCKSGHCKSQGSHKVDHEKGDSERVHHEKKPCRKSDHGKRDGCRECGNILFQIVHDLSGIVWILFWIVHFFCNISSILSTFARRRRDAISIQLWIFISWHWYVYF